MTGHLVVEWPDRALFAAREGRPVRLLAISDEPEPSLDSARTREALQPIELIVGCGDLQPEYLTFLADAFCVPLVYVRGNHDVGAAWRHEQRESLPAPLSDGVVHEELGLRIMGFSGSPRYNDRELQISAGHDVGPCGARPHPSGCAEGSDPADQPCSPAGNQRR